VLNERGAGGKVVLHSLDDAMVSSHFLGSGRPRPAQGPPLQLSYGGPTALVSDLPPDSIVAKQWRAGLLKLGTMIHSERVSPDTTECAESGVYGRWTCSGGDCPLCHGDCVRVDLRLMGVAGLMASCARCPPGSCPIAGPLYVSSYGALKGDHSVTVPTIVDPSGVPRMAPMSDFIHLIPRGTAIVPTGRPGSAKTHIVSWRTVQIIEQNVLEGNLDRFYFHVAPFQLLVAVTRKKINNLVYDYFSEHNPVVLRALRLQVVRATSSLSQSLTLAHRACSQRRRRKMNATTSRSCTMKMSRWPPSKRREDSSAPPPTPCTSSADCLETRTGARAARAVGPPSGCTAAAAAAAAHRAVGCDGRLKSASTYSHAQCGARVTSGTLMRTLDRIGLHLASAAGRRAVQPRRGPTARAASVRGRTPLTPNTGMVRTFKSTRASLP
jgi:hypothetical protein